jgi:V/A-type H+-transporting ATPase subunit D
MAILNINPTRMELTRLKRRLAMARRGHKLLKDKRDELMRQFLEAVRENKKLRREVEEGIVRANQHMSVARSLMHNEALAVALMYHKQEMTLSVTEKNIMSVRVPKFQIELKTANKNDIYSYGYAFTSFDLDDAVRALSDIMPDLLRLAEVEKACQLMASEIEKTRRRVNALEHVMIPQYQETIRYITMKLDENERSSITRLMKIKDMMIEKAIEQEKALDMGN